MIGGVILLAGIALSVARWEGSFGGAAAGEAKAPLRPSERRIDINSASVRDLERLPGMKPELVERIVQHRPYRKLDDLITKKVLGRKQFALIKDRIRVGVPSDKSVSQ